MRLHRRLLSSVAVHALPGRGRSVVATAPISAHTVVHESTPMARVLKRASAEQHCAECLDACAGAAAPSGTQLCSSHCEDAYEARGGAMLERVDLAPLHRLHEEDGRKFPLLIAELLVALLADIKRTGRLPEAWAPLELCYAELHEEAQQHVEHEHAVLLDAFEAAGLANRQTLELFLPIARYRRLLGAAQLNAFELNLSHGAAVSALLPGLASCFNHSCEPNVLISCGATSHVTFVAGEDVPAGAELRISYVDLDESREERRKLLLHKYGFECDCARCARGE